MSVPLHGDSRSLLTTVYDPDTGEPMATGRAPRPPWVDELMNERDDLREENDRLRAELRRRDGFPVEVDADGAE